MFFGDERPSSSVTEAVIFCSKYQEDITATGLAQSVERLTAEREVAGSIPGAEPILWVFKK